MSKFLSALKELEGWFLHQQRVLPWRNNPTVYRVWISEIMLQQTQVVTVIPFFEKFTQRFPSVEVLAEAHEDDVLLYWAGLGYYSRARNLHRTAKKMVENQRFPTTRDEWLEMPGVGNYTAGAILSIANNQVEAILDGNVERVLSRVRRMTRQRGDVAFKNRLWRLSKVFVKTAFDYQIQPSVLNQSLMELGATICTPKKPKCGSCPISMTCRAYEFGDAENFPPKKKPKEWIQVQEKVQCYLDESGRVLLRKRNSGEWRAGLWDLLDRPLSLKQNENIQFLGEINTRHIVTRHKIQRSTHIWKVLSAKVQSKALEMAPLWGAADSGSNAAQKPGFNGDSGANKNGAVQVSASANLNHARANLDSVDADLNETRWVTLENPNVAMGSALKQTLQAIRDQLEKSTSATAT